MIKRMILRMAVALLIAGVAIPAVYAQSDASFIDSSARYDWAQVLRVDPVYARTEVPEQECYDETVVQQAPPQRGTAGTLLGAVVGGVLGNTIGRGDGRAVATIAGAVAGGAIGNRVSSRPGSSYETTQTRCRQINVVSAQQRVVGYDVTYKFRGLVYQSRLSYDPGARLRIKIGISPVE